MSTKAKAIIGAAALFTVALVLFGIFGSDGLNTHFKPENEFKLDPWVSLKLGPIDMSINKAVLYLFIATVLTVSTMLYVAKRMQERPNRVQTAVEEIYQLMHTNITSGNMDRQMARKWFPFIGTLFLFIWFSNMIGYLPLPTNTEHTVNIFGVDLPSFALYAATANMSIPLTLALLVCSIYHVEGIRAQGFFPYLKSWIPAGVNGFAQVPIFFIEALSHFVRLVSLSLRLFANILAGHLLILFMGGGLAVILGLAALGIVTIPLAIAFFLFEIGLVATLQAFIFATLAAIYFGSAVKADH